MIYKAKTLPYTLGLQIFAATGLIQITYLIIAVVFLSGEFIAVGVLLLLISAIVFFALRQTIKNAEKMLVELSGNMLSKVSGTNTQTIDISKQKEVNLISPTGKSSPVYYMAFLAKDDSKFDLQLGYWQNERQLYDEILGICDTSKVKVDPELKREIEKLN